MQDFMFPRSIRFNRDNDHNYIQVHAVAYQFASFDEKRFRVTHFGDNNYNHAAMEKSLFKDRLKLMGYLRLIDSMVAHGYINQYQAGDKLIIFVATVEMATTVTKHLKDKHTKLDVRRYVADDEYANVIESDIRVTTIGSGGTGIDIKGLTCTIQTVSISSPVANLQSLGRLRNIPGRTVKFYYCYCLQISKQVLYHKRRKELFQPKVAKIIDMSLPYLI